MKIFLFLRQGGSAGGDCVWGKDAKERGRDIFSRPFPERETISVLPGERLTVCQTLDVTRHRILSHRLLLFLLLPFWWSYFYHRSEWVSETPLRSFFVSTSFLSGTLFESEFRRFMLARTLFSRNDLCRSRTGRDNFSFHTLETIDDIIRERDKSKVISFPFLHHQSFVGEIKNRMI